MVVVVVMMVVVVRGGGHRRRRGVAADLGWDELGVSIRGGLRGRGRRGGAVKVGCMVVVVGMRVVNVVRRLHFRGLLGCQKR